MCLLTGVPRKSSRSSGRRSARASVVSDPSTCCPLSTMYCRKSPSQALFVMFKVIGDDDGGRKINDWNCILSPLRTEPSLS
mmetsp:Transcript_94505/g.304014  ORF Transcript_94505/g.304014 Transcript_94505/m.304014 type:complete len:81 (+) Transcript_94505:181-423(+)